MIEKITKSNMDHAITTLDDARIVKLTRFITRAKILF